jgi:hypothetical protein
MKKYSVLVAGILSFMLVFGFALMSCDTTTGGDNNSSNNSGQDNGGQGDGGQDNGSQDNGGQGNEGQDNGGQDNSGQDNGGQGDGDQDNGGQDNEGQDNGGQDNGGTLAAAKGKLTLSGFNDFNGKYVYSALVTASGKSLIGTNAVELNGGVASISMAQISGGLAEVPLYYTNTGGTSIADIYVPYDSSETFQTVAVIIINDADGKFTSNDASSFATNYAAMISNNPSNTSFTPSTSGGNITISRNETKTMDEMTAEMTGGNYNVMNTVKYMLMVP